MNDEFGFVMFLIASLLGEGVYGLKNWCVSDVIKQKYLPPDRTLDTPIGGVSVSVQLGLSVFWPFLDISSGAIDTVLLSRIIAPNSVSLASSLSNFFQSLSETSS